MMIESNTKVSITLAAAIMTTIVTASSSDPRGCHLKMICAAARRGIAKEVLEPLRGLRELKRAFMLGIKDSITHCFPNFLHLSSIGPLLFPGGPVSAH